MEPNPELLSVLRSVPLFREFTEADLGRVCDRVREREVTAAEWIFRAGDEADEFYIILAGVFQVILRQEALSFEREIRRLGPGDYFGEVAILSGGQRTGNVRALGAGKLLVLHQSDLKALLSSFPLMSLALCTGMAIYARSQNARAMEIPLIEIAEIHADRETSQRIPPRVALYTKSVVVSGDREMLRVAMVDPYDAVARNFLINVLKDYHLEWAAISQTDFDRSIATRLRAELGEEVRRGDSAAPRQLRYAGSHGQSLDLGDRETAVILDRTFRTALEFKASDIHFEVGGEVARIRMRIDGKMAVIEEIPDPGLPSQLVSRLKIMADLDITNRRLPQDGRFVLFADEEKIEIRLAVMPCKGGEKVALRLLNPQLHLDRFDALIPSEPVAAMAKSMYLLPHGLILVCGPTGSGKTTTLYAGAMEIWRGTQTLNIVTIEDPIEYELDFATQVQINRAIDFDFASALRSILRQDPDVILVGEIRDAESAVIAAEAATTGHLVMSSLHTYSTLDAITRLRDLGVKSYLMAASLKFITAQVLAPRICPQCVAERPLPQETIDRLHALGVVPAGWRGPAYLGQGCDACRGLGTRGRVAVFEFLVVNARLRQAIERNLPADAWRGCVDSNEFIPMAEYARYLMENRLVQAADLAKLLAPP
jgi:type II secretory ATPase GspE/PulE/Tfp pilus assembly ATPase PilB-like protein